MTIDAGTEDGVREDAELIAAVRGGDVEATGELYQRHAGAALVVARRYTNSAADAEDVVSDAFAATFLALQRGNGPDVAFRAYLFTVVRRVAGLQRDRARRAEPTDDVASLEAGTAWAGTAEEPALEGFERGVVARAFHTLPERWQAVLWHTEVEGLTPAQIAPILGLTANGTAALAYRAREGLRQAYLQQHLNDPLDAGCRAAAGKLGAYVRGGLGTRENAQVQAHLDECGECRALVLELADVNHGMRAVIAPLVLGLAGMGALAHLLPVGGGLAAGAAALGGHAHAGSGAAAGAGAGGAAAAGAAAGAGGAGAAGAGAVGGIAAFIASIPTAAVAVAAGVLVLAGVATAAVMGLHDSDPGAAVPTPGVTSTLDQPAPTSTASTAAPSSAAPTTAPSGPAALPSTAVVPPGAPTAAPTGAPTSAPTTAPTSGPGPTDAPTTDPTAQPSAEPTSEPTSQPTTAPTSEPTSAPTSEPTSEPTTEPTQPPAAPAALSVVVPDDGLALDAGLDDQELSIVVANTGGTAASDLSADIQLPDGVSLAGVRTVVAQAVAGRFAAPVPAAWACDELGDSGLVHCTLPTLAPQTTAQATLRVSVDESYDRGDGTLSVRVSGAGVDYPIAPVTVRMRPAPARIATVAPLATSEAPLVLESGRDVPVTIAVRNYGGTASVAPGASVRLALPPGTTWRAEDGPWACVDAGDEARAVASCSVPDLAARATATPLVLDLLASRASVGGAMSVTLGPAGRATPTAVDVPYVVQLVPAHLTLTGDDAVEVPGGRDAAVDLTVGNTGEADASDVTVSATLPDGVTWAATEPAGWTCPVPDGAVLSCTRDTLAGGDSVPLTLGVRGAAGGVGDLGDLSVRVEADEVAAANHVVQVEGVAPTLALVTDERSVVVQPDGRVQLSFSAVVGDATRPGGADAADVRVHVALPANLVVDTDAPDAQTPRCVPTADRRGIDCALGDVADGSAVPVLVSARLRPYASDVSRVTLTARATGVTEPAAATLSVPAQSSAGLKVAYSASGPYGVTQVGAPLLSCARTGSAAKACKDVLSASSGNNNNQTMLPLDDAPAPTPRPSMPVSSSSQLALPNGAKVAWAGLYWAANKGPKDQWSGGTLSARLRAPGGEYAAVRGTALSAVTDNAGRAYYESVADVTSQVAAGGPGAWSVADVAVASSRTDSDPSYFAGWALVVAYVVPGGAETTVTVYDGGAWVGTSSTAPQFAFAAPEGSRATVGVVAWEGDAGTTGDQLTLASRCTDAGKPTALTPRRLSGLGSSGNAFDSTATGWLLADGTGSPWSPVNSLGTDVKAFVPASLTCDVSTLAASTTGDQYLIGAVTLQTEPAQISQAAQAR